MGMAKRWGLGLLAVMLLAYLCYATAFYRLQRQLLFPLTGAVPHEFRGSLEAGAQLAEPPVSFGRARGVFLPGPAAPAPVLLYFHGNGEVIEDNLQRFGAVRALGVHVFLLELPGYAGADGVASFDSLTEASVAAYDWLAQQPQVDRSRIVAVGRSIGGAPAAELSRHRPLAALVLLSTFASTADLALDHFLPGWLALDPFDSAARVREFPRAVLVMHGDSDTVVPVAHGRKLAAASPRTHWHGEACGHNDCRYLDAELAPRLGAFLNTQGILPTP